MEFHAGALFGNEKRKGSEYKDDRKIEGETSLPGLLETQQFLGMDMDGIVAGKSK
jgi:hypothetical protein